MKNFKAWMISLAVMCVVMIICGCAYAEGRPEFYPKLSIVTEIETIGSLRIIYCTDKDGMVWSFYDMDNEWKMGDIANLLMWAVNEREESDEIVEVYKEGHADNFTQFARVQGWL